MNKYEIKANELITEAVQKLIDKYSVKAAKEREKIKTASVTYNGEKYHSEAELMDAYSCDVFDDKTYDRLLTKLNNARGKNDPSEFTDSEMIKMALDKYRYNLMLELQNDAITKRRQAEIDNRIKALTSEGYSIREAKVIIENEELMRYE